MFKVIGSPIQHSLSPQIHQYFAKQFNLSIDYQALDLKPKNFITALRAFRNSKCRGLNVTAPLKQLAYEAVNNLSLEAKTAKSVNTITINPDQSLFGDNTDGIGLIRDLTIRHNFIIKNTNILIIGAGGAARGIIPAILLHNPKNVTIVNRTTEKAALVAREFKITFNRHNQLALDKFDLILNASSVAIHPSLIPQINLAYDLNYKFIYNNKNIINGIGMLIEQAAESFYIWHQRKPYTDPVYDIYARSYNLI